MLQLGITYSAYGEGPKPAFYGSPENAASAEKCTLLEGTGNIQGCYKSSLRIRSRAAERGIVCPYVCMSRSAM